MIKDLKDILDVIFVVLMTFLVGLLNGHTIGKYTEKEYVVKSCEKYRIYSKEGLIIDCKIKHKEN